MFMSLELNIIQISTGYFLFVMKTRLLYSSMVFRKKLKKLHQMKLKKQLE
jgi:hypothetical protein